MKNAAKTERKSVADPCAAYESMLDVWKRNRAICSGERSVKDYDSGLDVVGFTNLLLPFSPTMDYQQYAFYKAEAELPGICAQYVQMLVGGLLRKRPKVDLPEDLPEEAADWINNQFGKDDSSLSAFLHEALMEEAVTGRAWVYVDHPTVNIDEVSPEEAASNKPYPILWPADFVINWRIGADQAGNSMLRQVITAGFTEEYEDDEFHPTLIQTISVHELDEKGHYRVRVFRRESASTDVPVAAGVRNNQASLDKAKFVLYETKDSFLVHGEPLKYIPAWPLNGSIEITTPLMTPIVDKEVSLYNKVSRRNHLLYGAATYTPVVMTDMSDDDFQKIVDQGLGSWVRLRPNDTIDVLKTPTDALKDMDRAVAAGIEEMARLGIRMLSPESAQSGVALQLRNASQTAQLGSLNNKISSTMSQVIAFMLHWRYGEEVSASDIDFSMSSDFNPLPVGDSWLRLATEWYESGHIPRSVWLNILKHNDIVEPDYDDEEGRKEITSDLDNTLGNNGKKDAQDFADSLLKS